MQLTQYEHPIDDQYDSKTNILYMYTVYLFDKNYQFLYTTIIMDDENVWKPTWYKLNAVQCSIENKTK